MKFVPSTCAILIFLGVIILAATPVSAHRHDERKTEANATYIQDLQNMLDGNKAFQARMSTQNPGLLEDLALEGQKPPFLVFDCSDSRVSEQDIFSAKPGTMFTAGSIANQFFEEDINSNSVLSYAVDTLGVRHVIVMGHYGCGGVAAAMNYLDKPPTRAAPKLVQEWIKPITRLYSSSRRPEIVAHRKSHSFAAHREKKIHIESKRSVKGSPELHDPAFRALVEENVKASVRRIATSPVMQEHFASLSDPSADVVHVDVFIHGWVYDIENGEVLDLGVSVGPPGKEVPGSPFPMVKGEINALCTHTPSPTND